MFTLVQNAVGYFSGTSEDSELRKHERPRLEDFVSVSNFEREQFEGVVTTISERDIVIDDDIYFSIPFGQLNSKFKVGDAVQGMKERKTQHEAWRAVSLSHRPQEEGWDANRHKLSGKAIPSRDLDAGIPGILKKDLFSTGGCKQSPLEQMLSQPKQSCEVDIESKKTIIGKIQRIVANTVTLNEDAYFLASDAESSFELCIGDWVICKLDIDSLNNEQREDDHLRGFLKVTHVDPLRKKKIRGEVTHVCNTHYVINNEVYCARNLTKHMQLCRGGEKVVVNIIESEVEHFLWRAVSVSIDVSATLKEEKVDIMEKLKNLEEKVKNDDLFKDKHDVVISRDLRFPQVFIGNQSETTVLIKNTGSAEYFLWRVYFITDSQDCQFSVLSELLGKDVRNTPVPILPNKSIYVKLAFKGSLPGNYMRLCIFNFGDFHIGRYVTATIEDERMARTAHTMPYYPPERRTPLCIQPRDSRIVRGEKPFKAPAFLPVSLPIYHIPPELLVTQEEKYILRIAPFLAEPTNLRNYHAKYSALLHLEEIAMTQRIRQFDIIRTTFSRRGEFLTLAVPGLAERRPSLMVGDTVIASVPCVIGGIEYEGYIHEVHHAQVFIKFHHAFHDNYGGEDYSVRFSFNRTPLRRCHFAVEFSMQQLGADVLFPTKLKYQLPQVCYVDPETFSENSNRKPSTMDTRCRISNHQGSNSCLKKQIGKDIVRAREEFGEDKCRSSHRKYEKQSHLGNAGESGNSPLRQLTSGDASPRDQNVESVEVSMTDTVGCSVQERLESSFANSNGVKCDTRMISEGKLGARSFVRQHDRLEANHYQKKTDLPKEKCDSAHVIGKCYRDESFDEDRVVKGNCVSESTPASKIVPKKGSSSTPPRVPVVTRLFGVPSSGSSTNSSMCCSDDESKSFAECENETRAKKNFLEKRALSGIDGKVDGVGNIRKHLDFNDGISESCDSLALRGPHHSEERITRKCPPMKKAGDKLLEVFNRDSYHENENVQRGECDDTLQSKALGANGFSSNIESLSHTIGNDCVNETPVSKGLVKNRFSGKSIEEIEQNCVYREKEQDKAIGLKHALQQMLREGTPRPSKREQHYGIPVLPVKSSIGQRMKNTKVPLLKWINVKLNMEQKMAVRRILEGTTRPLPYVIYGPPGTGKTITLVETILQIFTLVHHSRLLVVAPSNSAADLVTSRLLTFGIVKKADLVRLNAYQRKDESIPENIRPYCCDGDQLSVRVRQRVIITTATTSGTLYSLGLHNGHFTHVFVDEAGQLTEPECLVALGLVNRVSGQIVLAGDPQQLGPVIQSVFALRFGLQESLLHRLCNSVLYQPEENNDGSTWVYEPCLVTLLVKNYRSHPDIISVPSRLFYLDKLMSHVSSEVKEKLLGWSELPNSSCPLLFHGFVGENLQEGDSPSWFNPTEAYQVVRYAKSLITFGVEPADIGVITPYRKQVQKIRQLLPVFGVEDGVKVGTVEEFQGQERVVIIISTVRSSEQYLEADFRHSLGFVKCPRRFNVAITRAQSLLVVIGNPLLLATDNNWKSFISYCIHKGAYRGPPKLLFDNPNSFD